jgi:hypothetical protein
MDFRNLVSNITPLAIDTCRMISGPTGAAHVIHPEDCPESDCNVDACFSIDISGSMNEEIDAVIAGAESMADLIEQVSNNSYRFSLSHFGQLSDSGNLQITLPLTLADCGNIDEFKFRVGSLNTSGAIEPWHQVLDQVSNNSGSNWVFRDNSDARIVFIITDESMDVDAGIALAAADELGRCGIRVVIIFTEISHNPVTITKDTVIAGRSIFWNSSFDLQGYTFLSEFFDDIAERTDGLWIYAPNGQDMVELMTSFILSVCATTSTVSECPGGTDVITNGQFETSVANWTDVSSGSGAMTWESAYQAMGLTGAAKQTITGLVTGDNVILNVDVYADSPSNSATLTIELRNGSGTVLTSGTINDSDLQQPGEDPQRLELTTTVPLDETIEVSFNAETAGFNKFYLDNILLCILKEDDCGPGFRNSILNPNFDTGVEFWLDALNADLPPTDPDIWDEIIGAITVSLTGEPEVRTQVTELTPGSNYSLNFELASWEPDVVASLELIYGILNFSGGVVVENTIFRSEVSLPERLQLDFTAPSDGIAIPYFKGGTTSGVAKIRNVLLCNSTGDCDPNFTKISFDDFETSRGAWAGGTHNLVEQYILLDASGGDDTVSQTFSSLQSGSTIQLTINVLNGPNGIGHYQVEMRSGAVVDQFNTTGAGHKTFQTTVQDTGVVDVRIKNVSAFAAPVDDFLVCQQNAPPCDGSITNMEVLFEWDGIPRKPTNLFNILVRYTVRDPNDPFVISTVTQITTNEGALGLTSCDTWKQEGQGGLPQTGVLGFGITAAVADTVAEGDFASISSRTNWIWSIPDSGGIQDSLSVTFPAPPAGLIESVEIFLLANHITPSGADTAPVTPPPLACESDPASELYVTLRYTNSQGLQRDFSQIINKNNIWQQNEDFTVASQPWDAISATGNGLKGSSARWESVLFVLDDVSGRGLDQCTTPLFFSTTGQGTLVLPDFAFSPPGRGIFVDACDSEVIITTLSPGESTNEVQSIILPNPSGGTWTIGFFFNRLEITDPISWDVTHTQLEDALESLSNIGAGNVSVTGTGTQLDPFLVEFVGTLAATDLQPMAADGRQLSGSSTAFVNTLVNGTINERQTIDRNNDEILDDFIVSWGGQSTEPLRYNRSLNTAQQMLEGIMGAGNVTVTGTTTSRIETYTGPLYVEFTGSLAATNVETMTVEPSHLYTVVRDWEGGPENGANEQQEVTVEATGGVFSLRIFDVGGTTPEINVSTVTQGGGGTDEVQNIVISGSPSGGTFTLNVEGEETLELPYNADATTVQNGLNSLSNLAEVVVTKSGDLPNDVTYTVTFQGADGDRDWQQIVGNSLNLTGEAIFADTANISFDADAATVQAAITSAAAWLNDLNILVTKVLRNPEGRHQWIIEWIGAFERTNIPQSEADESLLSGAPIEITEIAKGTGVRERQQMQIVNATAGSFRLTVTINGVPATTTAIPWNTTASGLQSQLEALSNVDVGRILVVDEYPVSGPPSPINASFMVYWSKIYGDVPLMEADFQETLLCDPIPLPPVDAGPYQYPIPGCDVIDLSCQSGPLLCKPPTGEPQESIEDCCDNETIRTSANVSRRIQIERDLFDPNGCTSNMTLRDLTVLKGLNINNYTPYERDFHTNTLTETTWSKIIETKLSFVLLENDLDSKRGRERVLGHIGGHREVLPARFVWPAISF